jgi:hypothetical protein
MKVASIMSNNRQFIEKISAESILQLCDDFTNAATEVGFNHSGPFFTGTQITKDVDVSQILSNLQVPVKANGISQSLKQKLNICFRNPKHEREFRSWYSDKTTHDYAVIGLFVMLFSLWHAYFDTYTFCNEDLVFKSPSLCLDKEIGWTILKFRIGFFAGVPLVTMLVGSIKRIPLRVREMIVMFSTGAFTYGCIFWGCFLSRGPSNILPDSSRVSFDVAYCFTTYSLQLHVP